MTVIMPPSSGVDNLLTLLADPAASKKLAQQASDIKDQRDALSRDIAKFDSEKKVHLAGLTEQQKRLDNLKSAVDDRSAVLDKLDNSLKEREQDVNEREHSFAVREELVSKREADAKAKSDELANREATLEVREKEHKAAAVKLAATQQDMNAKLADLTDRLSKLRSIAL